MSARTALAVTLAAAAALAGCVAGGGGGNNSAAFSDAAYDLSTKIAANIGQCWFAGGDATFNGYVYTPERNAGQSRILIVKKSDPTGLPALVVDATSGSSANVYGPLAEGAAGGRIRSDVNRWAKGGPGCA